MDAYREAYRDVSELTGSLSAKLLPSTFTIILYLHVRQRKSQEQSEYMFTKVTRSIHILFLFCREAVKWSHAVTETPGTCPIWHVGRQTRQTRHRQTDKSFSCLCYLSWSMWLVSMSIVVCVDIRMRDNLLYVFTYIVLPECLYLCISLCVLIQREKRERIALCMYIHCVT